jgi:capsular polysaccharide biosynthesis protein
VLAGGVLGVLAGLAVTLLLPTTYRAETTIVLVRQGEAPGENERLASAAEVAAALLESRTVADSVADNLRLGSAEELLERIEVDTRERSALLRLSVNADERDEARRSAQEIAQVFTVLYNSRFGPDVTASVWEGARTDDDPVSPRPLLNLVLGGLLGATAGLAVAALRRPRRPTEESVETTQAPSARLGARVDAVTARELALARRAAELALRERALAAGAPARVETTQAAPEAPEPERRAEELAVPAGRWTLEDVERLVAEQGPEFPERAEELKTYLDSIRGVAESDGSLPGGVEGLVEDVFADLIARARIGSRR